MPCGEMAPDHASLSLRVFPIACVSSWPSPPLAPVLSSPALTCPSPKPAQTPRATARPMSSSAVATMYELEFRNPADADTARSGSVDDKAVLFTIGRIAETINLAARLQNRERLPPSELDAALSARCAAHDAIAMLQPGSGAFSPRHATDRLFPGTFFLDSVGSDRVRRYSRRPRDAQRVVGGALFSNAAASEQAGVEGGTTRGELNGGACGTADNRRRGMEQGPVATPSKVG